MNELTPEAYAIWSLVAAVVTYIVLQFLNRPTQLHDGIASKLSTLEAAHNALALRFEGSFARHDESLEHLTEAIENLTAEVKSMQQLVGRSAPAMVAGGSLDEVAREVRQLTGEVRGLVAQLSEHERERNAITVTHSQSGMGVWGAVAVTACIFSTLMVIGLAIVIIPEIHDLRAWETIFGRDVAAMKQQLQHPEKP